MRKSFIAKALVLTAVFALAVAFMTGCGGGNEPATLPTPTAPGVPAPTPAPAAPGTPAAELPDVQEPFRLTIAAPYGVHDDDDRPIRQEIIARMEAYTNTEIEWMWYGADYWTNIDLDIVSGNIPTISVIGHRNPIFLQAINDGLFWDLTDYIDQFENLAYVHPVARENASFNGRLYGIPRARAVGRNGFGIRQDWLDNLGLRMPTTIDELHDVLWAFTHLDPTGTGMETVGLGVAMHMGPWDMMQMWFGAPNGWGFRGGQLVPAHMTEEYDEALRWFRRLYSEGLVNANFHELDNAYWNDLLRNNIAGFTGDVVDRVRQAHEHMYNEMGMANTWTLFAYVEGNHGPRTLPTAGFNNVLAISKSGAPEHADMLRALQFLNDLGDAYMWNLLERGIEGYEWEWSEDGFWHAFTDEERTARGIPIGNMRLGFNQIMPFYSSPAQLEGRVPGRPPHNDIRVLEAEIQLYIEQFAVVNYAASFVSETMIAHGPELNQLIHDMRIDFIRGVIDDTTKHEIRQQWLRMGGQDVIDEINALYQASR